MGLSLCNCTIQIFDWRAIDFLLYLSGLMFVIFWGHLVVGEVFQRKKKTEFVPSWRKCSGKSREKKKLGSWDGKCSVRPHLFNAMDSALHSAVLIRHRMMKILK